MKKIVSIILTLILVLLFCMPVASQSSDDLFYEELTPQMHEAIDEWEPRRRETSIEFFEEYYLQDGEQLDQSKITYRLDMLYANRNWSFDNALAFIQSEDKETYLKTIPISHWTYPLYYDGKFTGQYEVVEYLSEHDTYVCNSYSNGNRAGNKIFQNKSEILQKLEQKNITGYEILCTLPLFCYEYAIVQKDGVYYAVNFHDYGLFDRMSEVIRERYPELTQKTLLTMQEVEFYIEENNKIIDELAESLSESEKSKIGGGGGLNDSSFPWWIVGVAGAVIIAAGAATLIVLKKKKA